MIWMRRAVWVALGLMLAPTLEASDPIGIYALVDRVVLEPNAEDPERIQVWGAFAFGEGHRQFGEYYHPPVRGYLYYSLKKGKEEQCRNEWKDLARVAKSRECVGFASRFEEKGRLRRPDEKPGKPDVYPLGFGMQKIPGNHRRSAIQALRTLPTPVSPAVGETVDPGDGWRDPKPLTLVARNGVDVGSGSRYLFDLECETGEIISSDPIAAGRQETRWVVPVLLKPGKAYTWRVRVLNDAARHDGKTGTPVTSSHFRVRSKS